MSLIRVTIDDIVREKATLDGTERIPGRDDTGDFKMPFSVLQSYFGGNIGDIKIWPYDELPSAFYGWAEGGSLERALYPALYAIYFTDFGTCAISNGTPGVVTQTAHGLLTGSCISFSTTGALPTGLAVDTQYFVVYNDADSFWVSSTLANAIAGTRIATSSAGSGVHSLISNPHGFVDSTHFYLPNMQGVVLRGLAPVGGRTVGANLKYTYGLGATKEDQAQRITGVATIQAAGSGNSQLRKDATGAFATTTSRYVSASSGDTGSSGDGKAVLNFNNSYSSGARVSATTDGPTEDSSFVVKYAVRLI